MHNLNDENNFCIISDKLKTRLDENSLEDQISNDELQNDLYIDDTANYENSVYVQLVMSKKTIQCVLNKVQYLSDNQVEISMITTSDKIGSLLTESEKILKAEIITFDNSVINSYNLNNIEKKSIKLNDNNYIKVKLKFRK